MARFKQGTTFLQEWTVPGLDSDNVERVEFIFKQTSRKDDEALKICEFNVDGSGEVTLSEETFIIPWTKDETYLFEANRDFFMDTRIYWQDSIYNPYTEIVSLTMGNTLFRPSGDAIQGGINLNIDENGNIDPEQISGVEETREYVGGANGN